MNNPIIFALWINLNGLYQGLRFAKLIADFVFPRPQPAAATTLRLVAVEEARGRGRCVGPADLAG
ncbi:MAG: hypothetical protein ACFCUO_12215 [Rhodospirillales bacterium]